MSVSNKRGGAAGGAIVLDELSGILWEYWWLDPDSPPSAECWKMGSLRGPQNAQNVRKMQFLENCALAGMGEEGLIIFCSSVLFTLLFLYLCVGRRIFLKY